MVKHYKGGFMKDAEMVQVVVESTLRCKMRVAEVVRSINADGSIASETVKLVAVYGAEGTENGVWSKWTPSAQFTVSINNPDAFGKLSKDHEFYVDFSPANVVVAG